MEREKRLYNAAWEKALQDLKGLDSPYAAASRSGASYQDGEFRLAFFHRSFLIHYPEIKVEEVGSPNPPPLWLQVLLLHYLVRAKGIPMAEEWISYRDLPGAYLFEGKFGNSALLSLSRAFGKDLDTFRRAGLALGGTPMTRTGDAAFRFLAFPRIPVACILYLGEEEIPPSVNILFDAAAPFYLSTDELFVVGTYLSLAFREFKRP